VWGGNSEGKVKGKGMARDRGEAEERGEKKRFFWGLIKSYATVAH